MIAELSSAPPPAKGIKVLVCGGRSYADRDFVFDLMDRLHTTHAFSCLVHGGASGADAWGGAWARERGVPIRRYDADWKTYGNTAGPRRNKLMLEAEMPQMVVAFPGGPGTEDMVKRARKSGFVFWIIQERRS